MRINRRLIATAHSSPIRKGLHLLVFIDEIGERCGIEVAVGMGNIGPDEPENSRMARPAALRRAWAAAGKIQAEGPPGFA